MALKDQYFDAGKTAALETYRVKEALLPLLAGIGGMLGGGSLGTMAAGAAGRFLVGSAMRAGAQGGLRMLAGRALQSGIGKGVANIAGGMAGSELLGRLFEPKAPPAPKADFPSLGYRPNG